MKFPKHLNVLLTLVCLVILIPLAFTLLFLPVLALSALLFQFVDWFEHHGLPFALLALAILVWRIIVARRLRTPPAPPGTLSR